MNEQLKQLQTEFKDAILTPNSSTESMATLGFLYNPADGWMASDSAFERLTIYRHAYRARLLEALTNDFPALKTYWGDDFFDSICYAYIESHQSMHPSLRWYGEQFPAFINNQNQQAFAAELAKFEWTIGLAFDAQDEQSLTPERLTQLTPDDWATLSLVFHPSLKLLESHFNTADVWQQLIDAPSDRFNEVSTQISIQVSILLETYAIWRTQLQVKYRALAPQESVALKLFLSGNNLSEVFTELTTYGETAPEPALLVGWLKSWLQSDWIISINY